MSEERLSTHAADTNQFHEKPVRRQAAPAPSPSPESPRTKSVGRTILNKVFSGLQASHRWITCESGGFTWWASGFPTRVWAEPAVVRNGTEVTRLHASTALVRGAGTGEKYDTRIAGLNRGAALSAILRNATNPSLLELRSAVYVYPDRRSTMGMFLRQTVGLQAFQAFRTADAVASLVDGEPDVRPHPRSGLRLEATANLRHLREAVSVWGVRPSLFDGEDLPKLARIFEGSPCLLSSFSDGRLAAEFPFLGGSSLLEMSTEEPHETLGNGLGARLTLPVGGSRAERAAIAMRLNRHEIDNPIWTSFVGSWSERESGVTFTAFYPNFMERPELGLDVGMGLYYRARSISEGVFHDDWARIPARSSAERLMAHELPC